MDSWLQVPDWLDTECGAMVLDSVESRMAHVIGLARRNVENDGGGPFAAAVFDATSGQLIAAGVNRVMASACSHAHAEMVAIARAEQHYATHDLGAAELPPLQLVSSCEPCAMCLGAICWSGLTELVCAARDADARAVGFDEGPKPANWQAELVQRQIAVRVDVLRDEAIAVLNDYAQRGGLIY